MNQPMPLVTNNTKYLMQIHGSNSKYRPYFFISSIKIDLMLVIHRKMKTLTHFAFHNISCLFFLSIHDIPPVHIIEILSCETTKFYILYDILYDFVVLIIRISNHRKIMK